MKKLCWSILIVLIAASCASAPKGPEIFENPKCAAPCWENIAPGATTKEQAFTILSKIDAVNHTAVDLNRSDLLGFDDNIRFSLHNEKIIGYLEILSNQVSMISFDGELNLTLQNAIKLFDVPQSILVIHSGHFDQVTLLNAQKGISFDYKLFGSQNLESSALEPETEISGVTFFDPNQYQKILDSGILSAYTLTADQTIKNLHPWNGYGSFKDKYWPPAAP